MDRVKCVFRSSFLRAQQAVADCQNVLDNVVLQEAAAAFHYVVEKIAKTHEKNSAYASHSSVGPLSLIQPNW